VEDLVTKFVIGVSALGAGAYGMYRKIMADKRDDKTNTTTDAAWHQIIDTLREEVGRLSLRLVAVEEQNQKCEDRNDELHLEIVELKKRLHFT
jgi:hypothetical protein